MAYKIGLTGGIGSGKSTVAKAFSHSGIASFSADAISHEMSRKNQPAFLKIVDLFGSDIINSEGELDRAKLGDIVFNDSAQRKRLETILHPMIMQRMHKLADEADSPYCVLDIPLLVNTPESERVDRILVVECQLQIRIARIRQRNGWSNEKIAQVMANQVDQESLIEAADDLVNNDGDISAIDSQVQALHQRYLKLAGQV